MRFEGVGWAGEPCSTSAAAGGQVKPAPAELPEFGQRGDAGLFPLSLSQRPPSAFGKLRLPSPVLRVREGGSAVSGTAVTWSLVTRVPPQGPAQPLRNSWGWTWSCLTWCLAEVCGGQRLRAPCGPPPFRKTRVPKLRWRGGVSFHPCLRVKNVSNKRVYIFIIFLYLL